MEEDNDARKWRKHPTTERHLRQFLKMESGAYTRPSYRQNFLAAMTEPQKLVKPAPCSECAFVAETDVEIHWHEEKNTGHECCPDNAKP